MLTGGTWLAGLDGPPAMIMPVHPKLKNVYRSENLAGTVFEEMRVKTTDYTVKTNRGPVRGAIITAELSLTGEHATKVLAPGYGEFSTFSGADREDMALAVPIDALARPEPIQLSQLRGAATGLLHALQTKDWKAADSIARRLRATYADLPREGTPAIIAELARAADASAKATAARKASSASQSAIDVTRSVLDLQLRYRPPATLDRGRFELWCDQLLLDAVARDAAGASGDVATLEWIRDRLVGALSPAETSEVDARLHALRTAVDAKQFAAAGDQAARLGQRMRSLGV